VIFINPEHNAQYTTELLWALNENDNY